jgi:hypothetical protein
MPPIKRLFARQASAAIVGVLLLAATRSAHAELSLQTRLPDESQESDRDDNGKTDTYREQFVLNDDVTVVTQERLNEASQALVVRVVMIIFRGKPIWQQSYNASFQEEMTTAEGDSPFSISTMTSAKSGEFAVYLLNDDGLVAVLLGKRAGRLAPVSDDELERMRNIGEAVTKAGLTILHHAEELQHDESKANELLRELEETVSENLEDPDDAAESPNDSGNAPQESK